MLDLANLFLPVLNTPQKKKKMVVKLLSHMTQKRLQLLTVI